MMRAFFEQSQALDDQDTPSAVSWLTAIVYQTELGTVDDIMRQQLLLSRVDLSPLSAFDRCRLLRFRCHSLRIAGDTAAAVDAGKEAYAFSMAHRLFHDARLTAELLSFLFLDQNDIENASSWISLCAETTPDSEYSTTSPSLAHAQDRLLLQRGEFKEVASRLTTRLRSVRLDGTIRNRCGELATLALCFAETGNSVVAEELLDELLPDLPSIYGSFSGDYPVEIASRALARINRLEESRNQARRHIRDKMERCNRPLPVFYAHLGSARDELS